MEKVGNKSESHKKRKLSLKGNPHTHMLYVGAEPELRDGICLAANMPDKSVKEDWTPHLPTLCGGAIPLY